MADAVRPLMGGFHDHPPMPPCPLLSLCVAVALRGRPRPFQVPRVCPKDGTSIWRGLPGCSAGKYGRTPKDQGKEGDPVGVSLVGLCTGIPIRRCFVPIRLFYGEITKTITTFVVAIRIVGNVEVRPMNVNSSTSAEGQRAITSLPFSFIIVRCGYVSFTEVGLLKHYEL